MIDHTKVKLGLRHGQGMLMGVMSLPSHGHVIVISWLYHAHAMVMTLSYHMGQNHIMVMS